MDIKKVASLARLSLTDSEAKEFESKFDSIMGYFEQISKVDTTGVEPMVTPTEVAMVFRKDEVEPWAGRKMALENAPEKSGSLFKVPPVV